MDLQEVVKGVGTWKGLPTLPFRIAGESVAFLGVTPQVPLKPGTRLGLYTIGDRVGEGPLGWVYSGSRDGLPGEFLLHVRSEFERSPALEALLGRLWGRYTQVTSHAHVVRMLPPEPPVMRANICWYVLAVGNRLRTLRSCVEATPSEAGCSRERGVSLLQQACLGVSAFHDVELVLEDLLPENILIGGDGHPPSGADCDSVQVSEVPVRFFTNAQPGKEASWAALATTYRGPDRLLTATDARVGAAANVYSLGVVLFELLVGAPPFQGTPEEVTWKHRALAAPSLGLTTTPELRAGCVRCLAKVPAERPANARVVARMLETRAEEDRAFRGACINNTEGQWLAFLREYPDGCWVALARTRLDELRAKLRSERETEAARKTAAAAAQRAAAEAARKAAAAAAERAAAEAAQRAAAATRKAAAAAAQHAHEFVSATNGVVCEIWSPPSTAVWTQVACEPPRNIPIPESKPKMTCLHPEIEMWTGRLVDPVDGDVYPYPLGLVKPLSNYRRSQ